MHSDNVMAYDNAVSALGKICQFHRDGIDAAKVVSCSFWCPCAVECYISVLKFACYTKSISRINDTDILSQFWWLNKVTNLQFLDLISSLTNSFLFSSWWILLYIWCSHGIMFNKSFILMYLCSKYLFNLINSSLGLNYLNLYALKLFLVVRHHTILFVIYPQSGAWFGDKMLELKYPNMANFDPIFHLFAEAWVI